MLRRRRPDGYRHISRPSCRDGADRRQRQREKPDGVVRAVGRASRRYPCPPEGSTLANTRLNRREHDATTTLVTEIAFCATHGARAPAPERKTTHHHQNNSPHANQRSVTKQDGCFRQNDRPALEGRFDDAADLPSGRRLTVGENDNRPIASGYSVSSALKPRSPPGCRGSQRAPRCSSCHPSPMATPGQLSVEPPDKEGIAGGCREQLGTPIQIDRCPAHQIRSARLKA